LLACLPVHLVLVLVPARVRGGLLLGLLGGLAAYLLLGDLLLGGLLRRLAGNLLGGLLHRLLGGLLGDLPHRLLGGGLLHGLLGGLLGRFLRSFLGSHGQLLVSWLGLPSHKSQRHRHGIIPVTHRRPARGRAGGWEPARGGAGKKNTRAVT